MSANDRQHGGDHYKGTVYEYWDFAVDVGLSYLDGCAGKYVFRWRKKAGVLDLEKAVHYLEKCVEVNLRATYSGVTTERAVEKFVQTNGVPLQEATILTSICRGHYAQALSQARRLVAEATSAAHLLGDG